MNSRLRFVIFAAAFLLIIPAISGAQGVFSNLYCATSSAAHGIVPNIAACVQDTIPYVVMALLLSFALVAFCYLLGEVLNISSFKGWYRSELWEAIKSLLIVAVIFAVIVIFGEVATLLPNAPQGGGNASIDNLYVNAYEYLAGCGSCTPKTLGAINYTNESFNDLLGLSIGSQYLENTKITSYFTVPIPPVPVPEPPVEIVFDLGGNFNIYQSSIIDTSVTAGSTILTDTANLLVFPMLLVLVVQGNLFVFLIQLGIGILLPLGLIFRATPFLRSIGGTLIAIAIAAIIIYPALLALFNAPISYFFTPLYSTSTPLTASCPNSLVWCGVLQEYNPVVFALFQQLPGGTLNGPGDAENDYAAFQAGNQGAALAFYNGNVNYILNPLFKYVVPVIIAFILFVLDLIIGIVLAQNIARYLGGNIRLGIGKLKLA